MASYSELRVRLEPAESEPGSYDVLATGPTGETTGQFRLPLSKLELENIALRLSRGRNVVRRVDSPELERRMLHSLRLAGAAEARGQQAVQDRYMDQYSTLALQGRSRSFFVLDRTHLAGMARAIKESESPVP